MTTNSTIGLLQPDGSIKAIYCHLDGDPSGVGEKLYENYRCPKKVNYLMQLGDLFDLGEEIGVKQDFDFPIDGMCLAYGRDDGQANTEATTDFTFESWLNRYHDCDYAYLFSNGEWLTYEHISLGVEFDAVKTKTVTFESQWQDLTGYKVTHPKKVSYPFIIK